MILTYQWFNGFKVFQFILTEIQWFEFNTTTKILKTIRNSIFTNIQLKKKLGIKNKMNKWTTIMEINFITHKYK